jgi:cellulose biosynthesis protein BcsQ
MQTLAFLSQKGGSGKTTLAVHTAVAAQEDGERVVIVDTDLQKSATTWSDSRQSDTPVESRMGAVAWAIRQFESPIIRDWAGLGGASRSFARSEAF